MEIKQLLRQLFKEPSTPSNSSKDTCVLEGIARFAAPASLDIRNDIRSKYGFEGDLLEFFAGNQGSMIRKWHHYIPIYDRYFSKFRGAKVRFLEIGVEHGGSLQMWRKYLGEDATIFGIDINPACASLNGMAGQVRIGSQADPDFLENVISEMGGIDVVLDDGSHLMPHIATSLHHLFPKLSTNGVYMIEDLHAAYWPSFGGGLHAPENFFNRVSDLIADMHQWYHGDALKFPSVGLCARGIHVHDSIVVIEKGQVVAPIHSEIR